jgi:hypothetical protein
MGPAVDIPVDILPYVNGIQARPTLLEVEAEVLPALSIEQLGQIFLRWQSDPDLNQMIRLRVLVPLGSAVLGVIALAGCGAGPKPEVQSPKNNAVVRSVTTMTGSTNRARDAAAAMNQRTAENAAAANAVQ